MPDSALVLFKPSGSALRAERALMAMKPLGLDPSLEEGWRGNLTTILQWDECSDKMEIG